MYILFNHRGDAVEMKFEPAEGFEYIEADSYMKAWFRNLTNQEFMEKTGIYFVEGTAREAAEWLDRVYFDGEVYWLDV